MPLEILFVTLVGVTVFPLVLGIQCLHQSEKTARYSGGCIKLMCLGDPAITLTSKFHKDYQNGTSLKDMC